VNHIDADHRVSSADGPGSFFDIKRKRRTHIATPAAAHAALQRVSPKDRREDSLVIHYRSLLARATPAAGVLAAFDRMLMTRA
jgi:hypothetical protein